MVAYIHNAQLAPTKIELLRAWVPDRPWLGGTDVSTLEAVGAFRFDDPADEVGIETHLLRAADGRILHVPLTYRGAPLAGAGLSLIGTMEHSVLGERWVYDGCADPVYATALATAILTGGTQSELEYAPGIDPAGRPVTTRVVGSGAAGSPVPGGETVRSWDDGRTSVIRSADLEIVVVRVIGSAIADDPAVDEPAVDEPTAATGTLLGRWPGNDVPAVLATVELR